MRHLTVLVEEKERDDRIMHTAISAAALVAVGLMAILFVRRRHVRAA